MDEQDFARLVKGGRCPSAVGRRVVKAGGTGCAGTPLPLLAAHWFEFSVLNASIWNLSLLLACG